MRILYILPFVPWPLRVRSFNLIPRLAMRHEISLLCLTGSTEEEDRAVAFRDVCRKMTCVPHTKLRAAWQCGLALATPKPLRMAYFDSPHMREAVAQEIKAFSPEIIYLERWRCLPWVPEDTNIPLLCDPTDSMLLYNRRLVRSGGWVEKLIGVEEFWKFRSCEPAFARRASVSVFCSQVDLDAVRQYAPEARFAIVPNGIDCRQFFLKDPADEESGRIIFTGNFGYAPNRHAIRFFMQQVFPIVREGFPGCRLTLVGNQAVKYFGSKASVAPDIDLYDFVPDLRPHIARAAVSIAPITIGVGVTNKILEAFATGTATVATRLACGDLPLRSGEHLLSADRPDEFAQCVLRLLKDAELRRTLAANARTFVEQRYDWNIVVLRMEDLMLNLARGLQSCEIETQASSRND